MLDKSQAACRQLLRRAKQHLKAHRPRYESQPSNHDRLVHSFFQAIEAGDMEPLTHLLSEDVIIWTDGGGKVAAALEPICGRVNVMRFITGSRRLAPGPFKAEIASVNGRAAILHRLQSGPSENHSLPEPSPPPFGESNHPQTSRSRVYQAGHRHTHPPWQ
jgi:RNA polymerase sigma-70 factor (ECF subfamily)